MSDEQGSRVNTMVVVTAEYYAMRRELAQLRGEVERLQEYTRGLFDKIAAYRAAAQMALDLLIAEEECPYCLNRALNWRDKVDGKDAYFRIEHEPGCEYGAVVAALGAALGVE